MSAGPGLAFAVIVVGLVVIALAWLTRRERPQPQPTRQWCRDLQPLDLCSVCWTDHADGIPFPDPAKETTR